MPKSHCLLYTAAFGIALTSVESAQPASRYAAGNAGIHHVAVNPKADVPPTVPISVQDDIRRIAGALEATNVRADSDAEQKRAGEYLQAQKAMAKWAGWMFCVGAFEAIVTLIGVILVGLTLKAARTSAYETKRAADAAHASVASMQDTAKRQLRAYLITEGDGIQSWPETGMVRAQVRIFNTGQTPATHVCSRQDIRIYSVIPDHDFTEDASAINDADMTIGPGRTRSLNVLSSATVGHSRTTAKESRMTIVVYGSVSYTDIFGESHTAKFCHTYGQPYIGDGIVRYFRHGNCAD